MPFEAGASGNPGGRPKSAKQFRDALQIAIKKADRKGVEAIQRVADRLVAEAENGNVHAIREIADRIDGKVPQAIAGADGEGPVIVQIIRHGDDGPAAG